MTQAELLERGQQLEAAESKLARASRPTTAQLFQRGITEAIQEKEAQRKAGISMQQIARAKLELASAKEQIRRQSPEYQEWAYREARRLIEAGAPVSFAENADVKFYYYQIQKGLPKEYAILPGGKMVEPVAVTQTITQKELAQPTELPFIKKFEQQLYFIQHPASGIRAAVAAKPKMAAKVEISEKPQHPSSIFGQINMFFGKADIALKKVVPRSWAEKIDPFIVGGLEKAEKPILSIIPEGRIKSALATKYEYSPTQELLIPIFFSPLFSSQVAAKKTKQVTVTVAKKEAAKKISGEEFKIAIKATSNIREGEFAISQRHREVIRGLYERLNQGRITPVEFMKYKQLFESVLGKAEANAAFLDIAEQEGMQIVRGAISPKPIPKAPPIKVEAFISPPIAPVKTSSTLIGIPRMVGGAGEVSSIYAGKGLYEVSSGMQIPKTAQTSILKSISLQQFKLKDMEELVQPQISPQVQPQIQPQISPQIQPQMFKQKFRYDSRSASKYMQKSILPMKSSEFGIKRKIREGGFFERILGRMKRKAYEVQIRRRGKFFAIGKGLPLGRAARLGAEKVKATLAATFRLVPKGTTAVSDIAYKPSGMIFRQPKRAVGEMAFVERRRFRLKAPTEVTEIQAAKRGKRKWF